MATATAGDAKAIPKPKKKKTEDAGTASHTKAGIVENEAAGTIKDPLVKAIPLDQIGVKKGHNPRKTLDEAGVADLAKSMKKQGLMSAITVAPNGKNGYYVIAGERRLLAAKRLGWKVIPASVRTDLEEATPQAALAAVAENVNRQDLNAIELGAAFAKAKAAGCEEAQIASECGVHIRTVRRHLELLEMPNDVQQKVVSGELSATAAAELGKLDDETRKAIRDAVKPGATQAEIKAAAKSYAKQAEAEEAGEAEDGEDENEAVDTGRANEKKGKARDAAQVVWKQSRAKQDAIRRLAFLKKHLESEKKTDTADYDEVRGGLAYALWDRGDLDQPYAPPTEPKDADEKKLLKVFNAHVDNDAAKYVPPTEDGDGSEDGEDSEAA